MDQIKEGQKQGSEMIKLRVEIEGGRKPEFQVRDDGVIVRGSRMCIPEIGELKREIMEEAHSSAYAMHLGSRGVQWVVPPGLARGPAHYIVVPCRAGPVTVVGWAGKTRVSGPCRA